MLHTNGRNTRPDAPPPRSVILVAITDEHVRATRAYVLSAAGFDVVTPDPSDTASAPRPDVVLIDLADLGKNRCRSIQSFSREWLCDVPIVALVPEVGQSSCERARRLGCAAVCLATCSSEVLVAGLRAVLERFRERHI